MPRSLIDCRVLSFTPGKALDVIFGGSKRMIFLDNDMDGYSGRLFIHSTRYPDAQSKEIGFEDIKAILACYRGVSMNAIDPDKEIPECAMLGWCKVTIEPYNELMFEHDYDYHGITDTWEDFMAIMGWTPMTTVHAMSMTDFHGLKSPIVGIRRDNAPDAGEIWTPGEPIELEAMKMALEPDRHFKTPVNWLEQFDKWCEDNDL